MNLPSPGGGGEEESWPALLQGVEDKAAPSPGARTNPAPKLVSPPSQHSGAPKGPSGSSDKSCSGIPYWGQLLLQPPPPQGKLSWVGGGAGNHTSDLHCPPQGANCSWPCVPPPTLPMATSTWHPTFLLDTGCYPPIRWADKCGAPAQFLPFPRTQGWVPSFTQH